MAVAANLNQKAKENSVVAAAAADTTVVAINNKLDKTKLERVTSMSLMVSG